LLHLCSTGKWVSNSIGLSCFALLFSGLLSTTVSEERSCSVSLPVTVFLPNLALLRNLGKEQFAARDKKSALSILYASPENGPRRIVFVVETGRRISSDARKVEAAVLQGVLSEASPDDSVALLTARGPSKEVRFGESHEALESVIAEIGKGLSGHSQQAEVLDAVNEAADWLQPHQQGDAILLLSMKIENDNPKASFEAVSDRLVMDEIRLFGVQLDTLIHAFYSTTITSAIGGPIVGASTDLSLNKKSLFYLSDESGGFGVVEDTTSTIHTYKLTDSHLAELKEEGKQFCKAIEDYYRLTLQSSPQGLDLDVSGSLRAKFPQAILTYPKKKDYCLSGAPRGAKPYPKSPKTKSPPRRTGAGCKWFGPENDA
jgi:hypothetical protein